MTNLLVILIILGIGTARITALLAKDKIFHGLREFIFYRSPPEDNDMLGYYYQAYHKVSKEEAAKKHSPWHSKRYIWNKDGDVRKEGFFGALFSCTRCLSVWVALFNYLAFTIEPVYTIYFNVVMGMSFISSAAIERYYR
jgi:hypothetical protein